MIDFISKPKLPKGISYVLKTSQLEQALKKLEPKLEEINCQITLDYWIPQKGNSIFEANYWLPNHHVSYPRIYIRAGAISSELRIKASTNLVNEILPDFINWLDQIVTKSSPVYENQYFNASYSSNGSIIVNKPEYKKRTSRF